MRIGSARLSERATFVLLGLLAYVHGRLSFASRQRAGMAWMVAGIGAGTALVGCTRYCNIAAANRRLEIGYTWYAKRVQRTALNTEAKRLLLAHAFEDLGAIAVETVFRFS